MTLLFRCYENCHFGWHSDVRCSRTSTSICYYCQSTQTVRFCNNVVCFLKFQVLNFFFRCIDVSKRVLLEKFQDTQCDAAGKLSQSIYVVESLLGKCHQESDLLFFTIRQDPPVILFASTSYVPMLIKRYMVPGKLTYPY